MNNELINFVLEQFKSIAKRIEQKDASLAGEIRLLAKLLDKVKASTPRTTQFPSKNVEDNFFNEDKPQIKSTAKRPVHVLKQLFNENPDKGYEPTELKKILNDLKEQGELLTNSNDMLALTHTSLRVLTTQQFVTKEDFLGKPVYKLKR